MRGGLPSDWHHRKVHGFCSHAQVGGDWMHLLHGASPNGNTVLDLKATYNLMMQAWQCFEKALRDSKSQSARIFGYSLMSASVTTSAESTCRGMVFSDWVFLSQRSLIPTHGRDSHTRSLRVRWPLWSFPRMGLTRLHQPWWRRKLKKVYKPTAMASRLTTAAPVALENLKALLSLFSDPDFKALPFQPSSFMDFLFANDLRDHKSNKISYAKNQYQSKGRIHKALIPNVRIYMQYIFDPKYMNFCNMNQIWKRLRIIYLPPAIVLNFL